MADQVRAELSANDSLWLTLDTPENLMIIDTVLWFHHRLDPEAVIRQVQERVVDRYPVFHWKPRFSDSPGARHAWLEDPDFDIHRHITVHELGGAGGRAEMQSFLEARMSEPLDPARPLWRAYILEGNDFGALMIRFHHAIADGTALARVLLEMTTEHPEGDYEHPEPDEDRIHPADQTGTQEPVATDRPSRRKRDRARQAVTQAATLPLAAGVQATSGAAKLLEMLDLDREGSRVALIADHAVGTADALDKILVGTPPKAPFTRPGIAKRADWAPAHDLDLVKRAAKTRGATVNDLMLAGLAGGLRRYLEARGEPISDLMTVIPVNLRPVDDPLPEQLGNKFALVTFMLPLEENTPVARLDEAHRRMEVIKSGPEALLTFGAIGALGIVGTFSIGASRPVIEVLLTNAIGITTNVPGPQHPRYLAGQEMVGILGWVPAAAGLSVYTCIFSYNNEIRVGFKTDVKVIPDISNLVAAYNAEMDELLGLGAQ